PRSTRARRRRATGGSPSSCHGSREAPAAASAGQSRRCTSVDFPAISFVNRTSGRSASSDRTAKIRRPFGWLHHDPRSDSPVTIPTTLGSVLSCWSRSPFDRSSRRTSSAARMARALVDLWDETGPAGPADRLRRQTRAPRVSRRVHGGTVSLEAPREKPPSPLQVWTAAMLDEDAVRQRGEPLLVRHLLSSPPDSL